MHKPSTIRSIANCAAKLVGDWTWTRDGNSGLQLQIKLPQQESSHETPIWEIKSEGNKDHVFGVVRAYSLCHWLGLEQLTKLDIIIARKAACIALQQDHLAHLLGITHATRIVIDESEYQHGSPEFMEVRITTPEDEPKRAFKKKTVTVLMPTDTLIQQLDDPTTQITRIDNYPSTDLLHHLSGDIALNIGNITLSAKQLTTLSPGCLMLISGEYVDRGILQAQIGSWIIEMSAQHQANTWMIKDIHQSPSKYKLYENIFSSLTSSSEQDDMNIDEIPVNIQVHLTHANVKFSDLKKIQPGALIDIGIPHDAAVKLMCNDVQIAEGLLVELDSRLAVEILTISPAS